MKKRIFVVVVCLAFLAVTIGMASAECEPMTQGFYKRVCTKPHPSGITVDPGGERCDALKEKSKGEPCLRASAQLAALSFNLELGLLTEDCEGFEDDGTPATVGDVLDEIEALLVGGNPADETCKEIADLADMINSRDFFVDPYLITNLYDVEQNHFYQDIYASAMKWLNNFLKTG